MTDRTVPLPLTATATAFPVLFAASMGHFTNDLLQALLPASYPILEDKFALSFAQVGILTLVYQLVASILQPIIGTYTDRRPLPWSLPVAMLCTMAGILILAFAPDYTTLVLGSVMLGLGSSIFHPEASRIARLASGGSHGLAQSLFQVGGNFGSAIGPLAAAFIVLPRGQAGLAWFALLAVAGIVLLAGLGHWYRSRGHAVRPKQAPARHADLSRTEVRRSVAILIALLFSKYAYLAAFTSFYTFYLMAEFGLTTRNAQILHFVFLAAAAAGTIAGGPIGDRFGRKLVIWVSILGALPLALVLPHVGLVATVALSAVIAFLMSSAFPTIVVYGQELMPGRIGMVSGLFFGVAFGVAGSSAAILGWLADLEGLHFVFVVCSFLPAIGILAAWLPNLRTAR